MVDTLLLVSTIIISVQKLTFLSTIIIGLIVHTYRFTNTLLNHDALYNYYSDQNIIGSGRWFLSIACGISSDFDLPWLIGIMSILFIAITAVLVVDILKVKNKFLCILVGGLVVSFPAVTETFFFEFTADGYMLAMLLAALSVKFSLLDETKIWKWALSAVFLCLSCGIYQAYVSFAMTLVLSYLILEILEGKRNNKEYLLWSGKQIGVYAVAMAAFYAVWKVCLHFQQAEVNNYLGIDEVGEMSFNGIKNALFLTAKDFVSFFVDPANSLWSIINVLTIISAVVAVVAIVVKRKTFKRKLQLFLSLAAIAAIPFAVYVWYFTSPGVEYKTRMLQSICMLYILIAVLYDRYLSVKLSTAIGAILTVFVFFNCVSANVFYYYMNLANRQSYSTAIEMSIKMHELDDGTIKKIYIGGMQFTPAKSPVNKSSLGPLYKVIPNNINLLYDNDHAAIYLNNEVGFELSYYQTHQSEEINFEAANGYPPRFSVATEAEGEKIMSTDEYKTMPCWPAFGSVAVIKETIVVKLSD